MIDEREIPDASERFRNDAKKGDRKNYEGKSYDGKSNDGKKKFDKGGGKGKHGDRAERGAKPQSNGDTEFVYVEPRPQGRRAPRRPRRRDRQRDRTVGPRDRPDPDHRELLGRRGSGRTVDGVVSAMSNTTMRGKKAKVRRYTD